MAIFLDILLRVTLPIVALVALGYALQGKLKLDVPGLNRLQVFVVLPAFLLHHLSTATQPLSALTETVNFTLVQFAMLIAVGWLAALVFGMGQRLAPVMAMATVYANVGFFGIPLVQLAFPPAFILHQSVITSMMTILVVTLGAAMLAPSARGAGMLGRLKQAFETPVIPAVMLGLALRGFEITLPPALGGPIEMLGRAFTPLALYTLGAQLRDGAPGELKTGPVSLILVLKLMIAPALTWGLAILMGLPKDLTELVVVGAATPVGVLLGVFCAEYNREPRLVASSIMISTALSPLFVTLWIILVRLF